MYIVFPTFEVAPIQNGGIGQYILSTIKTLQETNYVPLVILYNSPYDRIVEIREYFQSSNLFSEIFHINDFSEVQLNTEDIYDQTKTALAMKQCLASIISQKQVAGIEWCDHAGVGYQVLIDKQLNPQSVFKEVSMWVHIHGSREIWELTDRYPADVYSGNPAYILSNYNERICLELADAWKCPSKSVADWYADYYGIQNKNFISALPYRKLDSHLSYLQRNHDIPKCPIKILVPGRIQYIKGNDIVARACVNLCSKFPNQFHVTFAGYSNPSANSEYNSSLDEVKSFIPKEFLSHFSFLNKFSAEKYLKLAKESHLAVFASRVETFCLAAHEINWLGLPLVLSDIPAFKDHFQHKINCYKFNDVESLTNLLSEIISDPEVLNNINSQPVSDFNVNIFQELINLPFSPKANSNYLLFTKFQEIYLNQIQSGNLGFKELSTYSLKLLIKASVWKFAKKLADKISASPDLRIFVKKMLK